VKTTTEAGADYPLLEAALLGAKYRQMMCLRPINIFSDYSCYLEKIYYLCSSKFGKNILKH